jgi:hypothetical protein
MLYDLPTLRESNAYQAIPIACQACARKGESAEACQQALYRDSIGLPPRSVVAVIFGADCPSASVENILQIVEEDKAYGNTMAYWSALHSARYAVHYCQADHDYVRFYYKHRDEIVAGAKGHYERRDGRLAYLPSRKGETFDMTERATRRRSQKNAA